MRISINFDPKLTRVPALMQGDKEHLTGFRADERRALSGLRRLIFKSLLQT